MMVIYLGVRLSKQEIIDLLTNLALRAIKSLTIDEAPHLESGESPPIIKLEDYKQKSQLLEYNKNESTGTL